MDGLHVLALDQGTSSSRAILFDSQSRIVATAQKELSCHYPHSGWVEQNPEEIWLTQKQVMEEMLFYAQQHNLNIAAIGITNQRETTLVWDRKTGTPIYPALVWQDQRTTELCAQLKQQGLEEEINKRTGKRLDPYFSATKLAWILDNVDGARARAQAGELAFGTVDSWLIWQLTKGKHHLTDASNASRTLLYNLEQGTWDDYLLELFQIPASLLPKIVNSSGIIAQTETQIPIAGVAGDQQAALFGQACFQAGLAKNTYGTGCFLLMYTGEKPVFSQHNLLTTVAWRIQGKTEFALEGSVFMGGAILQWLRDELEIIETAQQGDLFASQVEDSNGVVFVPAFAGLGAPHWDSAARGLIIGMTRGSNKKHLCRAALEAIALQSEELVTAMQQDCHVSLPQMRVDGGASNSKLLMQIQADILGKPVVCPPILETTALGAAWLAGLATGVWQNKEQLQNQWQSHTQYHPQLEKTQAYTTTLKQRWHKAVSRAKGWEEWS